MIEKTVCLVLTFVTIFFCVNVIKWCAWLKERTRRIEDEISNIEKSMVRLEARVVKAEDAMTKKTISAVDLYRRERH